MTTPLEQIKERLEKLKDDGINPDTGLPHYLEFNKGMVIGRNTTLDEVITLLPSIIQEVVGKSISSIVGAVRMGIITKDKGYDMLIDRYGASLKEESK